MTEPRKRATPEFEQQIIATMPRLRAFAVKLTHDESRAEDLVQETVLKALANFESFRPGTNLSAWVTTILRNEFYTRFRKTKREVEDPDDMIAKTVEDTSAASHDSSDEYAAVMDRLDAFDPVTRGILLDCANGFSYEEAAKKYGIALGTVKSRINRARQVLLAARNDSVDGGQASFDPSLRPITVPQFTREIKVASDFGTPPILRWLPISVLRTDPSYQREILDRGRSNVVVIAEQFDWNKFGTVVVAAIDNGLFAVIDGQHRTTAALLCGHTHVPCQIIEANVAEQADAFAAINGNVTALTSIQIHQAKVAAGDPETVRLEGICKAAGVTILRYPVPADKIGPAQTMAVGTLRNAMRRYGDAVLIAALVALSKTRGGNPGMFRQQIIQALCIVLSQEPKLAADPDAVVEIAKTIRFERLWNEARMEASRTRKPLTPLLVAALRTYFGNVE